MEPQPLVISVIDSSVRQSAACVHAVSQSCLRYRDMYSLSTFIPCLHPHRTGTGIKVQCKSASCKDNLVIGLFSKSIGDDPFGIPTPQR